MFRHVLARASEDRLLIVLLAALAPLLFFTPERDWALHQLVDWKTVGALAGLMILSRGLEESGYLGLAGQWLLQRVRGERLLAIVLILFSACLASVITNDVALFIVVPLTLSLRQVADIPLGRLVIFEALAVNAGSALSPIGNPQNLFLWQASEAGFLEFTVMMAPLALALTFLLIVIVPLAFPGKEISASAVAADLPRERGLFWVSMLLYMPFLILADLGYAAIAPVGLVVLFLLYRRRLLLGVDWLLLLVFVLMFIDMNLLAGLPAVQDVANSLLQLPGQALTAGVLASQIMSNVPAAIFLASFTDEWRDLAWGVSVGGFGLAIGSLANLIALRLAREPGLWREFHYWSVPILFGGWLIAMVIS
ncbi:SLC13 family permease [Marinobacter sp. ATCH36]|uniref:SLC13 family permease n=1 Tax=Marinobacter sp. ATCH36 TaxID=2945106 RepID=UPI002020E423|nr:SLC13 family permease [Marinobacter sp. ATCH36]MCL7943687.1 SLC13 family permease [Marinobacter sp. ATCH36]